MRLQRRPTSEIWVTVGDVTRPRALAVVAFATAWFLGLGAAHAQPTDNDFAIDLFQGPVLAPIRVTSMGGAYAGYAEGIAGFVANAASPSVRHSHSTGWWDGDVDASVSIPIPLFGNNDFDNSGDIDADYTNFVYLAGGAQLQAGPFGLGAFGDLQRYTLSFSSDEDEAAVVVGRYHLLASWGFLGDQLHVGGGPRALTLSVTTANTDITFAGVAPQIGILVKPDWTPFRFGATYRHPVSASTSIGTGATVVDGVRRAGNLVMPDRVELPWEIEIGTAVQVGPRPLNPQWIHPDDHEQELRDAYAERKRLRALRVEQQLNGLPPGETRKQLARQLRSEQALLDRREERRMKRDLERLRDERRARAQNWPREALLLTLDLLVTGPVDDAIHLERFLAQGQMQVASPCVAVASGEEANFSPRLGLEMEPFVGWMHTRFGTYYEPNRYRYAPEGCNDRVGRQHFTFGADVKLASTTWFGLVPEVTYKLQAYGDLAPRYQSFGAGFGVWY
jgi:hypothetical protein